MPRMPEIAVVAPDYPGPRPQERRMAHRPRDRRPVYTIAVAAELAGLHPQTLRNYERRGLVRPARAPGGGRRYSDADVARLRRITELTEEGLTLAGVARVLDLEDRLARLTALMDSMTKRSKSLVA